MIKLGTPETIFGRELMEPMPLGSTPTRLPRLKQGHSLICDVIRVPGVDSLNHTVVVENEGDMKSLVNSYSMGMIIELNWYSAPDVGFIHVSQVQPSEESASSTPSIK